jgi:transcriptional antiterminator RfaH
VISSGDTPIPVSDELVGHVRRRTEGLLRQGGALSPGDTVAVVDGPFRDLEGVFCSSLGGEQRVIVLLNVLRRQTRVELPARHIVPIVDPTAA